ncbi:MAG: Omp28-related outer membrane protein [Chitinophagales bacterium]
MKKAKIVMAVSALVLTLAISGCKEVIPDFPANAVPQKGDTTYVESPVAAVQRKKVMIEEFTGVNCVNCPQGAQILRNIEQAHPGNIVEVGMHSNFLSEPFSYSKQDFRTADAEQLSQYLVDPGFKPAAAIDRVAFDAGNPSVQYDRNSWPGYVDQQLALTSPLSLSISNNYNATTRELTSTVEVHFTQAVSGKTKLTVVLAEDSINSAQLDAGNVVDTVYFHRNVARKFLTAYTGNALSEDAEPGRFYRRIFKTILPIAPVEWKAEHIHIMAYIHRYEGSKEVLQAAESDLQ